MTDAAEFGERDATKTLVTPPFEGSLSTATTNGIKLPEPRVQSPAVPAQQPTGQKSAKQTYPAPASRPTQGGPKGIRFDFNLGCRVTTPAGSWRVRLRDLDTGNIVFDTETGATFVNSTKRYFIRFGIEVWEQGKSAFQHNYNAADRDVLIQFPVGTLGDLIGWFPYAEKFQKLHRCRLTCAMSAGIIPLFRDAYPHISFVTHEEVRPERFYATYSIGLFFDDDDRIWQPSDFRLVGLHRTAGYILGVDPTEQVPQIVLPDESRPIAEPYVCIAVQSTTQSKYWNNPYGWLPVIAFLKQQGYRVICIDQKRVHGHGMVWTQIPHGAEDQTGDRPLVERARWLRHAEFFIGLSSGLSWLAWATGTPVVLISGFTHPINEFATPYRVINYHACNSCWNDVRHRFSHQDFLWCPRHKDTPRQFECTRLITAEQVIAAIARIPKRDEPSRPAASQPLAKPPVSKRARR